MREGPVFPLSAHQPFGGEECAQGLKKGHGAREAEAADLSWANLGALLSSCHLQSQRIKGGGARREEWWEGGSLRKDSKFRQGVGEMRYKGTGALRTDRDSSSPGKRRFGVGCPVSCP